MAVPNQSVTMHRTGAVSESMPTDIRSQDFPFLADMLNSLYSRPIEAVIREISTNAWDSHVDAGVARPIEVTLPTADRLELVIEDFGLGMNRDDLHDTFRFYGASSKRGSNEVAGQLGVGSKSPLSYAEAFTIEGVKDGVKTVAIFTKDDHGLGVIDIVGTFQVDQANGVKITIPVDAYDVSEFHEAAASLYQFWPIGQVIVDGRIPDEPEWAQSALAIDPDTLLVRHDALDSSYVIMGNVAYPVEDATHGRVSRRFVARLNIGDVDFVPSREDVKYTDWTTETLDDLHHYVRSNYNRVLNNALANVTSPWEEAQIRMLWKGAKGTSVTARGDRRIWTYDPSVRRRGSSRAHNSYGLANVISPNVIVITGFGAKSVSATAKGRLTERFGRNVTFVIVPAGAGGTYSLHGRPNTFTWEDVVGSTSDSVKAKRSGYRGPKVETRYSTNLGSLTAAEIAEYAEDTQVLLLPSGGYAYRGDMGCLVVTLYSTAQEPRLRRYAPDLRPYDDEVADRRKAAEDNITVEDRAIVEARARLSSVFTSMDPAKVADPDLAAALALRATPDTATMLDANHFGVEITYDETLPDFRASYPLATNGDSYHRANGIDATAASLAYVNAMYASTMAAQSAYTQAVAS